MPENTFHGRVEGLPAKFLKNLYQPLVAGPCGCDLGIQIAQYRLWHAGVETDELQDLFVRLTFLVNLRTRKNQAFLMHVGGVEHVAGVLGTEIHPVRADARVGERLGRMRRKDRRE